MKEKIVLLVEDNPDDEALALRALRKCPLDFQIIVARDGEEALDFLFGLGRYAGRDLSVMPALILLDMKLPKMDGLEVLRRMRQDDWARCIPIVVMTTSHEQSDILSSYRYGANSFITKPVDFEKFMQAMNLISVYWLTLNTLPSSKEFPL